MGSTMDPAKHDRARKGSVSQWDLSRPRSEHSAEQLSKFATWCRHLILNLLLPRHLNYLVHYIVQDLREILAELLTTLPTAFLIGRKASGIPARGFELTAYDNFFA